MGSKGDFTGNRHPWGSRRPNEILHAHESGSERRLPNNRRISPPTTKPAAAHYWNHDKEYVDAREKQCADEERRRLHGF